MRIYTLYIRENIKMRHSLFSKPVTILLVLLIIGSVDKTQAQNKYLLKSGIIDSLYSEVLRETREIYIQLPESYDPAKHTRYPLIYVLDAENLFSAVSTVHNYYWGGFIPEMIIVGISNSENRTRDLTPSSITSRQGADFNQESGGAENFTSFLEKELIPYIESAYPASTYRTLIGHSFGGLFTINTLIKHPKLFQNYLAIDPSLDWDKQLLLKEAKDIFKTRDLSKKSLFISLSGQLHMQDRDITIDNVMGDTSEYTLFARSNIEFSEIAKNSKLNIYWKYYPNDIHGSIPLPSTMDGLVTLFNWYPIESTDMFNSPGTPKEELISLIRNREKKLKDHFGYFEPPFEEGLLTMLGYMNMDWGENEKSLAFFKLAIEYFPKSASAYESLADYYLAQDDTKNTVKNLKKAFEISGEKIYKDRIEALSNK